MEHARSDAEVDGQARSRLVASISHELRTRLGGGVELAHLLKKTPLSSEQRELTALIGESADAVVALLNDLLEFARLDVGPSNVEPLPGDVGARRPLRPDPDGRQPAGPRQLRRDRCHPRRQTGRRAAKRAAAPDHSATNGDPTRHVPIVALTATSASHERARALEAGMDDHVHKPLDAAHLATLLRVHVGRTRPSSSPPTTTAPADAA